MRKLAVTVMAAATILLVGSLASKADPASSTGTAIPKAAKNFSPIQEAACRGFGPHCPPGFTWTCGGGRCWCRPCM
jgi:hypothetical protein